MHSKRGGKQCAWIWKAPTRTWYTASYELSGMGMFMKSALMKSQSSCRPVALFISSPRLIWNALLFNPVTEAPVNAAISRSGPPTPHPTSRTLIVKEKCQSCMGKQSLELGNTKLT